MKYYQWQSIFNFDSNNTSASILYCITKNIQEGISTQSSYNDAA